MGDGCEGWRRRVGRRALWVRGWMDGLGLDLDLGLDNARCELGDGEGEGEGEW